MSEDEILKGKKLIAEFLEIEYVNDDPENYPEWYWYRYWDKSSTGEDGIWDDIPTNIEDWEFHTNYGWIMQVVEKIESLKYIDEFNIIYDSVSKGTHVQILSAYKDTFENVFTKVYPSKIEAIFVGICEFLKDYNANHKSWK